MRKLIAIVLIFATMVLTTGPAVFASESGAVAADSEIRLDAAATAGADNLKTMQTDDDAPPAEPPVPSEPGANLESQNNNVLAGTADTESDNLSLLGAAAESGISNEVFAGELPVPGAISMEIFADTASTVPLEIAISSDETPPENEFASPTINAAATTMETAAITDNSSISPETASTTIETVAVGMETAASSILPETASTTVETVAVGMETAAITDNSSILPETASTTVEIAANAESGLTAAAAAPQMAVLAVWQMAGGGLDDDPAAGAQFAPSGEYRVSKKIRICGVADVPAVDGTDDAAGVGVYSLMFYPKDASFGPNDPLGRIGCGQAAGSACKMEKLLSDAGNDLFCGKIQSDNANLPQFAAGLNYSDLCSDNGRLLSRTASVYCCDRELAYDDIPGDYEAAVMAKMGADNYSNMLSSKFAYLPLSRLDIDFNNIYYGEVKEGVEAVADETVTSAAVRNVGNVPARITLWQDDMGLGKTDGADNIRYGARLSNVGAAWTYYGPFTMIVMPDVLSPGQSVDMDFSVKVLNFPETAKESKIDYTGQMKIDAVSAFENYQCQSPRLNENQPIPAAAPVPAVDLSASDVKFEADLPKAATTTVPILI